MKITVLVPTEIDINGKYCVGFCKDHLQYVRGHWECIIFQKKMDVKVGIEGIPIYRCQACLDAEKEIEKP